MTESTTAGLAPLLAEMSVDATEHGGPVSDPRGLPIAGRINLAVAAGGSFGALSRVELDRLLPAAHGDWPWATFLVNIAGALVLGYLGTRLLDRLPPSTYRRPFAGTGFCGALTTFSTFQVEIVRLARQGEPLIAISYAGASTLLGLVAVFVATRAVRRARWSVS